MDTLRDVPAPGERSRPHWLRRIALSILLVIVLLGATGVFGVRSRSVRVEGSGYTLTVTYPLSARAGLDVPWRARVHKDGGVNSDLTIAVSTDYFRMFETQGFFPDADSATNDGKFVYMTFKAPPPGQDFLVDYDAYIQPSAQLGKSADVRLIIDGKLILRARIRTWLVP
jgi:hypothetical protein